MCTGGGGFVVTDEKPSPALPIYGGPPLVSSVGGRSHQTATSDSPNNVSVSVSSQNPHVTAKSVTW